MRPTDQLQNLVSDDWQAATRHPFTDALAAGTLEPEKMAGYLVQDYMFLESFVRLLASAVAHAPSLQDALPGAQFLGLVTGSENTYFRRAMDALGAAPDDVAPATPTAAFRGLMHEAAASGRYEQMVAVLTVAEWSYLDWATPHAPPRPELPFYFSEWIELHSGDGFEGVVAWLRGQLDTVWEGLDMDERRAVEATFARATRLERDFFDAAWAGFPRP